MGFGFSCPHSVLLRFWGFLVSFPNCTDLLRESSPALVSEASQFSTCVLSMWPFICDFSSWRTAGHRGRPGHHVGVWEADGPVLGSCLFPLRSGQTLCLAEPWSSSGRGVDILTLKHCSGQEGASLFDGHCHVPGLVDCGTL